MDVSHRIRRRAQDLGIDQKQLAAAASVTESYISQLLSRKKAPPAPGRTDIYEKLGNLLQISENELCQLAEAQRHAELKKKIAGPPGPLYREIRGVMIRKCAPKTRPEVLRIFEKEAFGELERLTTQTVLDTAKSAAREELRNDEWLRSLAKLSGRRFEEMRVAILEFLDTELLDISLEGCVSFLDPIIHAWDIDLNSFAMDIHLNARLVPAARRRFAFVELAKDGRDAVLPELREFLKDKALSGDISDGELAFLKQLRFGELRPTPLYFYRELQSLRDPLHFRRRPGEGRD